MAYGGQILASASVVTDMQKVRVCRVSPSRTVVSPL